MSIGNNHTCSVPQLYLTLCRRQPPATGEDLLSVPHFGLPLPIHPTHPQPLYPHKAAPPGQVREPRSGLQPPPPQDHMPQRARRLYFNHTYLGQRCKQLLSTKVWASTPHTKLPVILMQFPDILTSDVMG